MAQNSKDTSQYLTTPVKNWYLDLWVPRSVSKSDYDNLIVIPPEFDQRPDLLSQQEYGTPALWWVFALRNPDLIIDPINDFVSGLEIFVPPNPLKQ
jgi:hypothetical protein